MSEEKRKTIAPEESVMLKEYEFEKGGAEYLRES